MENQENNPIYNETFLPTYMPSQDSIATKKSDISKKLQPASSNTKKKFFTAGKIKVVVALMLVLGVIGAVFGVIVASMGGIQSIFPWLFPSEDGDPAAGMNSQYGANYSHFYGNRVVYRDTDLARLELLNEYNSLIVKVVTEIEASGCGDDNTY